ncbi:MAG: UTP--glucose-1-phosphate uridylyltransferase [Pirellulaceae bacterium]|nr:UTP--glucose-1-phosphate uridylyltransferase [Pirellulaceae bacterium]
MSGELIEIITSTNAEVRNRSLEGFCCAASAAALHAACDELDRFRRDSENLYERVRALFLLSNIYRYHLPAKLPPGSCDRIPYDGYQHLLQRRFDEALRVFLDLRQRSGDNDTIASALAAAYHQLGFQTLADQVRRSVRSVRGNQWMFRVGHPGDHPLRIRRELLDRPSDRERFPVLWERTPVRMDLSHSAWSDIFFLGMDFPEGARVLNVSVDLGVRGRDAKPRPPIEVFLRVIDEPVLRLASVDLRARADVSSLAEVFDFAKDYLGLLKAGLIAAGIVPSGLEGAAQGLGEVLGRLVGPGLGLEIVSHVNDIPKGSRLAVSTNLLAAIITACMRATRQIESIEGQLSEAERRQVAARAILGEWLAGSGGGWQDSGGIWPAVKMIEGQTAAEGDPEWGISRGRLLPAHHVYSAQELTAETRQRLCDCTVLVHGGMAQNVGPILEMVTEKYLLRSEAEWAGRQEAMRILDRIDGALRGGKLKELAAATTLNFFGPIQTIIPWASNHYTETLIRRVRERFAERFWGFLMLGGMSGGGMGFFFEPTVRPAAQDYLQQLMSATKRQLQDALPFAMEPVVYDFSINEQGTVASLVPGGEALMPSAYYALVASEWIRRDIRQMPAGQRAEVARFVAECRPNGRLSSAVPMLFANLFPVTTREERGEDELARLLAQNGFDAELHEQIRSDLRSGRIGLAQNRLPARTVVEDVCDTDVVRADTAADGDCRAAGLTALACGEAAVLTLAAGAGSRWTQGAGVVKALHPFHRFGGRYRNFIEVHLAKSRRVGAACGTAVPHIVTTGYLTHPPIERFLRDHDRGGDAGPLYLSRGMSVGLRMVPMPRDLRFAWEEMPQQILDEQAQKVRASLRAALIGWAEQAGGGSDYTDNVPLQCLHPTGHWFEVANLLRNGTLAALLRERPGLNYLMLHNIDTLGADLDPAMLGLHIGGGGVLSFEVIGRRIEDHGGGLARVDGRPRLLESLAIPREEDEFRLTYYNSLTTWITIDRLLAVFGLTREELDDPGKVAVQIRRLSARMPTYITLKEVKRRWGHGQEDVFPVAQFEKLWGDMTALPEVACRFLVVPRSRGQQLKDQAQLDSWLRDGSAAYVDSLCKWEED